MGNDDQELRIQEVAKRLKALRLEAGYTSYEKFAIEMEMQPKQYWRLENGEDFKISTLIRILDFYELTFEAFFKGVR